MITKTSKSKKRKSKKIFEVQSSLFIDEEQIATENLFNASHYHDNFKYEKQFNEIFNLFHSVDLSQTSPKKSLQNGRKPYNNQSLQPNQKSFKANEFQSNEKFQESKVLLRLYETLPNQNSPRTLSLRIRKKKLNAKNQDLKKKSIFINSFKSDSVFVGITSNQELSENDKKKKHFKNLLFLEGKNKDDSYRNNFRIKKQKDSKLQFNQTKIRFEEKQSGKTSEKIKSLSPQIQNKTIYSEYSRIKRLQSVYNVSPVSKKKPTKLEHLKICDEKMILRKELSQHDSKKKSVDFGNPFLTRSEFYQRLKRYI